VPPLFKKIKNAEFFAPFNYLIFEEKNKCRNQKNQRPCPLRAGPPDGYTSLPSGELWARFRITLYRFLKNLYRSNAWNAP